MVNSINEHQFNCLMQSSNNIDASERRTKVIKVTLNMSDLLDFPTRPALGYTKGLQKGERIVWAAVLWAEIPCWCQRSEKIYQNNQSLQTKYALKQMSDSSRRPCQVPLLSVKNSSLTDFVGTSAAVSLLLPLLAFITANKWKVNKTQEKSPNHVNHQRALCNLPCWQQVQNITISWSKQGMNEKRNNYK